MNVFASAANSAKFTARFYVCVFSFCQNLPRLGENFFISPIFLNFKLKQQILNYRHKLVFHNYLDGRVLIDHCLIVAACSPYRIASSA